MAKQDRHKALEAWIADAIPLLGLEAWEITVLRDAADVTAHADIDPAPQRWTADLRLAHDFFAQSPEKQRLVLTHELIHLVVARADQVVENLEEPLGKIAFGLFEPNYVDASERAVEHLARIIAPFLPLPELPKN